MVGPAEIKAPVLPGRRSADKTRVVEDVVHIRRPLLPTPSRIGPSTRNDLNSKFGTLVLTVERFRRKLEVVICHVCGHQNRASAKFCEECDLRHWPRDQAVRRALPFVTEP